MELRMERRTGLRKGTGRTGRQRRAWPRVRIDEAIDTTAADTRAADTRADGGSGGDRKASVRRCVVTRAVRPKAELLRFVIGPDGAVVPDLAATLPGRGVWVSSRREALDKACKANMFARSAKTAARVPDDLAASVESMLARRCVELLGLARRAGQAVGGYEKVRDWVARGRAGLLIEAVDGAADGDRKGVR